VSHDVEGADRALPRLDELRLGRWFRAGQPAQPQVLGVDPGQPGHPFRPERTPTAVDPLRRPVDPGEQLRGPLDVPGALRLRRATGGVGQRAEEQAGQPDPGREVR
jgi:hypothetical protein